MKYFLVILLFCPTVAFTQLQSAKSRLTGWGLKGKVKQLTDYFYDSEKAFKEKHPAIKSIYFFDSNGREIEEVKIEDKKTIKTFYRYLGRKVIDTSYSDGQFFEADIEILDTADRLIESDLEVNNPDIPEMFRHFKIKTIFKYDEHGRQTELEDYDQEEKLLSKENFIYNNKNQLVEDDYMSYRLSGIQTIKTITSYNESGLKLEEQVYESEKLTKKSSISYKNFDQQGNWLLSTDESEYHSGQIHKDSKLTTARIREISYFQ